MPQTRVDLGRDADDGAGGASVGPLEDGGQARRKASANEL